MIVAKTLNPSRPINWASPLNRGLLSRWQCIPGNGFGGNKLRDLNRGNRCAQDFKLNGSPAWGGRKGRPGGYGSLSFNGTSQWLSSDTLERLNLTSKLTLMCWLNPTSITSGRSYIFDRQSFAGSYVTEIYDSSGYRMRFDVIGVANYDSSAGVIVTGKWQHLAWVYDTDANTATYYVNGVSVGQSTSVGDIVSQANVALNFGRRGNTGTDRYFSGLADDIRVYGVALGNGEVAAVYREACAGSPETLNWLPVRAHVLLEQQAGGGATAYPWHYYQQMMAG